MYEKGSVLDIEIYQDWKQDESDQVKVVRENPITEVGKVGLSIDPDAKTIHVNGEKLVNCQAVYSRLKGLWSSSFAGLIGYSFPMSAITWVLYEMQDGWKITNPELLVFGMPEHMDVGLRNNDT